MIDILVENLPLEVPAKISVLEACRIAGILVPRFCYHEMLSVAGNCRMCLIEVNGMEKPVASCATEAKDKMSIFVESAFAKKCRENVLETILINHPLDCPICDQGGECDLQDQAKHFGMSKSRYFYAKKVTTDKICNSVVKTVMTRCITCTRCVRYASEITGIEFFGTLGRGRETEIGSFISELFESGISGNVVDLCPVGALNNKAYSFKARPWELSYSDNIDLNDSLQTKTYVNFKGNNLYRILPKKNRYSNIITDNARYMHEHNSFARVKYVKVSSKKSLHRNLPPHLSYKFEDYILEAIHCILKEQMEMGYFPKGFLKFSKINFIIDNKCDLVTATFISQIQKTNLLTKVNIKNISSIDFKDNLYSTNKVFLDKFLKASNDICLLIGTNTTTENALLNNSIRTKYGTNNTEILTAGYYSEQNVPNKLLTMSSDNVFNLFEGFLKPIALKLMGKKRCSLLIGESFLKRIHSINSFNAFMNKFLPSADVIVLRLEVNAEAMNLFNNTHILNNKKNKDGSMSRSVSNSLAWCNRDEANFFLNNEDNIFSRKLARAAGKGKNFMFYTNYSPILEKAHVTFPVSTVFEKDPLKINPVYLNIMHLPQYSNYVLPEKGMDVKSLSEILMNIFQADCAFDMKKFFKRPSIVLPYLKYIYDLSAPKYTEGLLKIEPFYGIKLIKSDINTFSVSNYPMKQEIKNFYESNYFCKNSPTLKKKSINYKQKYTNFV